MLVWTATKAADSLTAEIALEEISLSSLTLGGEADVYFAQMAGTLRLSGVIGGRPIDQSGPGFFETYLRQDQASDPVSASFGTRSDPGSANE
jgi:hypothetical protein